MLESASNVNPSQTVEIQFGPFVVEIEKDSGQLRYLRAGTTELLRGIYGSVRRSDWGTVLPTISDFQLKRTASSFTCTFTALHEDGDVGFEWNGTIEAILTDATSATLLFQMNGRGLREFKTNRTGLCVLQPRSLQGQRVEVEHPDRECEIGQFPANVNPNNPYTDIKSLMYEAPDGSSLRTEFIGEEFEMEDQRNWSDPSFKTYCRPQKRGTPYTVQKEVPIRQSVKLTIHCNSKSIKSSIFDPNLVEANAVVPQLGTLISYPLTSETIGTLKKLDFRHVQATSDGLDSAQQLHIPVMLQSKVANVPISLSPSDSILLSPPQDFEKLNQIRGAKRFVFSPGDFGDLNRNRPNPQYLSGDIQGVFFGMNPQAHAFDTKTILESTWTLYDLVTSAKALGAKEVGVGPIQLRGWGTDPRMKGIESALFTFAALCHLSIANADYATFFEASQLIASPAHLIFSLLSPEQGTKVKIFHHEPTFVAWLGAKTVIANLSWQPSETFKLLPIDSPENLAVGIKGSHRVFTSENIQNWQSIAASHNPLTRMPPYSLVVVD